jgi:hypothetical protein
MTVEHEAGHAVHPAAGCGEPVLGELSGVLARARGREVCAFGAEGLELSLEPIKRLGGVQGDT